MKDGVCGSKDRFFESKDGLFHTKTDFVGVCACSHTPTEDASEILGLESIGGQISPLFLLFRAEP